MSSALAQEVVKTLDGLKSRRGVWESHWQEIAEFILPRQAEITGQRSAGEKRADRIFEAGPALGLDRFSSAMEAMLTPRSSKWHNLSFPIEEMAERLPVKKYFDEVTKLLFRVRYRPKANYASQQHETYTSVGAFGTGVLYVGEDDLGLPFYKSIALQQCYIAENGQGFVDTLYRCYPVQARNIPKLWPDAELPDDIRKAVSDEPYKPFEVVHAVYPREERDKTKITRENLPFASVYVLKDREVVLEEGGEHEFPYVVSRYVTAPSETYGRSPAMIVLGDIKMVNAMSKEAIVATHLRNRPPMIGYRRNALSKIQQKPGAVNWGMMDQEGRQLLAPMNTGADPAAAEVSIERRMRTIDDAFLVTLMRVLTEHPDMTATQALMLAQEKGVIMGPTMGRQQSEALGPMIERELNILSRNRLLPEPPQEVIEAQGEYTIEYDSPINRAQKAEEGLSLVRSMEQVLPLVQIWPEIADNFDSDEIGRLIPDINGAPSRILREMAEVMEMRAQRQKAAQEQQMIEAAPQLAKAANDGSQAVERMNQGAQ